MFFGKAKRSTCQVARQIKREGAGGDRPEKNVCVSCNRRRSMYLSGKNHFETDDRNQYR